MKEPTPPIQTTGYQPKGKDISDRPPSGESGAIRPGTNEQEAYAAGWVAGWQAAWIAAHFAYAGGKQ